MTVAGLADVLLGYFAWFSDSADTGYPAAEFANPSLFLQLGPGVEVEVQSYGAIIG